MACSLYSRSYYDALRQYLKILKQRNSQIRLDLENSRTDRSAWDRPLVQKAVFIMEKRNEMAKELARRVRNKLTDTGTKDFDFEIQYNFSEYEACNRENRENRESNEKKLLKKLTNSYKKENVFKTTVTGPHRDSIDFTNRKKNMRHFSSQGEKRLAITALKLALVDLLGEEKKLFPLLLFDDILLEIDEKNLESFLSHFTNKNQFFFTSTSIPDIPFFRKLTPEQKLELC